jgi:DNA invertase Pin-like site-specific DNA recombinase
MRHRAPGDFSSGYKATRKTLQAKPNPLPRKKHLLGAVRLNKSNVRIALQAIELRKSGMPLSRIADRLGISHLTAKRWCVGVTPPKRKKKVKLARPRFIVIEGVNVRLANAEKARKAQQLRREGMSLKAIAKQLGRDYQQVRRWCSPIEKDLRFK